MEVSKPYSNPQGCVVAEARLLNELALPPVRLLKLMTGGMTWLRLLSFSSLASATTHLLGCYIMA